MSDTLYKKLSEERKSLQEQGLVPSWMTTAGWQMFKDKYLYDTDKAVRGQFERIASTAAKHLPQNMYSLANAKFFELLWNGWLSASTPVLANTGTSRGLPVSCSGNYMGDSIDSFYTAKHEIAILTKHGFGTSSYLGSVRPRGAAISVGGKANGVPALFKGIVDDMEYVSQGNARRGAWAGYIELEHGDFDEIADFVLSAPDGANVGWIVTDKFISDLEAQDDEAVRRFQKSLKIKMVTGRGYYFKVDTANRLRPVRYKDLGLDVKASNLCAEISLHSSEDYTYTCILSSMNLSKWDEWKSTDAVYWATIFLDCIASEFIERAKDIHGLERAVEFTRKSRALGLGVCGFHTYLQKKGIPFESLEAGFWNKEVFNHIKMLSTEASKDLFDFFGQTEWADEGMRNSHLTAIAPTKSTALIMGGISEGINPDPAMVYTQLTPSGEITRINPQLLELMKERGVYNKKHLNEIIDNLGSVRDVGWLSADEKSVFKTAFEINQEVVIRYASQRQPSISQSQSLNLFFSADEDPAWIGHIHRLAFLDKNLISLYYITTMAGVQASKDCEACQ